MKTGHYHPNTILIRRTCQIFRDMGFEIAQGPEIETEHYNFDALNIPEDHPARDMWDTFWLEPNSLGDLLRTHTSSVQIRFMEENKPPFRIISPGRVYRYEATDATHEAQFCQLEGLVIGEGVTLGHLKGTLDTYFSSLFGVDMEVRLRPSFFPFVEPGVEIDMRPKSKEGDGPWLEIMGAGMVHPKVLREVGIDTDKYQGFAFGGGIDRLSMLRYGIDDVRLLYNGDLRLINQF